MDTKEIRNRLNGAKGFFAWIGKIKMLWNARRDLEYLYREVVDLRLVAASLRVKLNDAQDGFKVVERKWLDGQMERRRLEVANAKIVSVLKKEQIEQLEGLRPIL